MYRNYRPWRERNCQVYLGEFYTGRPVLIVGGSRLLGLALTELLRVLGARVLVTSRRPGRGPEADEKTAASLDGEVHLVLGPESPTQPPPSWIGAWARSAWGSTDPVIFVLVDASGDPAEGAIVEGLGDLLRVLAEGGRRLCVVHASTLEVYGAADKPWREHRPPEPTSTRGRHKYRMEVVLDGVAGAGSRAIHLRYGGILGPGEDRWHLKPVPGVVNVGVTGGGRYYLKTNGRQWRYYMSSETAALAAVKAGVVKALEYYGGPINVMGDQVRVIRACGLAAHAVRPWGRVEIDTGDEEGVSHEAAADTADHVLGDLRGPGIATLVTRYARWVWHVRSLEGREPW